MKSVKITDTLSGSAIIQGCMRINDLSVKETEALIETAIDNGIDWFDHSDYYKLGLCEKRFGDALRLHPEWRDKIKVQDKFGICPGYFDFSREHLTEAVEESMKRLGVDYLDTMLLHRPDTLVEPEEVAEVFDSLYSSGKVRAFGVSNMNPMQIELLKKYVGVPLVINQLQLSILECGMIGAGLNVNMTNTLSYMHDGGILEYSRINGITIQAWSPFQIGFFEGTFLDNPEYPKLNETLGKYAEKYGVTKSAVAVAWILRHPANMQVLIGTTKARRVEEICRSSQVSLSRQEWYELYTSAGHTLP